MTTFQKQNIVLLRERVEGEIKNAIEDGRLKPGGRIIEYRIAKEMGISRLPVREAFRRLEREGLLVSVPYHGTYIANFDENDIDEIYSLRNVLETFAIRRLMEKGLKTIQIKELRKVIKRMEKLAQAGEIAGLIKQDFRFHELICSYSGHLRLMEFWLNLNERLKLFLAIEGRYRYQRDLCAIAQDHKIIVEALEQGETNKAEKIMTNHIITAGSFLKKTIASK